METRLRVEYIGMQEELGGTYVQLVNVLEGPARRTTVVYDPTRHIIVGGVMILHCTCINDYQDLRYGVGQRVHTPTRKENGKLFRCTVCGNLRPIGSGAAKQSEHNVPKRRGNRAE